MKPSKEPMEPSTEPMVPSKEPLKPSKEPMKPSKKPTKSSKEPAMNSSEEPMKPSKEPTKPSKEPMKPSKVPKKYNFSKLTKVKNTKGTKIGMKKLGKMKLHLPSNACKTCGKRFKDKSGAKRHQMFVHDFAIQWN